jgi:hypothetical protein
MVYSKSVGIDDIDVSKASSLLANDSKLSQKLNLNLAQAHNGQRAFFNKDFPQAIREFYLIFEDTGRLEEMKYKNLRHAVSHIKLCSEDAVRDLRCNFHIPIQRGDDIDLNDAMIKKILGEEAGKLRNSAGFYLNRQLKKELEKEEAS